MPHPTLAEVKNTLLPVFDRIYDNAFRDSQENFDIPSSVYIEVYTISYNYMMKNNLDDPTALKSVTTDELLRPGPGGDIYQFIDRYFQNKSSEIASNCPVVNNKDTMKYILDQFTRYQSVARMISRLVRYLDRDYIQLRTDEGAGWLGLPITSHEYISRQEEELQKWEYDGTPDGMTKADALVSARAASPVDRLIPIYPLALRRFRVSVVEPMVLEYTDMANWVKDNIFAIPRKGAGEESVTSRDFKAMLRHVGVHEERLIA